MANNQKALFAALLYPLPNLRNSSSPVRETVLALKREVSPKASVLLIALWSLCLLTVFAVYLGNGVRQKITLIERLNSRDSLHFIAEAGAKQAIAELRRKESADYYALNQGWSTNPAVFQEISVGLGEFSVSYNYLNYQSRQKETRYGLIDEERKLNLNQAELEVIQRLIMLVTDLEETDALSLAAAIVDWRDSDSDVSIPLGSAEDSYYQNLTYPYEAKDAEFEILDELLLVKGMDKKVFQDLENYVTIYGNSKININTAAIPVLLALGLEDSLVDKIIAFRCGEDGTEATDDDEYFQSVAGIAGRLKEEGGFILSSQELNSLVGAQPMISVSSSNFMARTKAGLGRRESEIICIFNREGKILSWKEG